MEQYLFEENTTIQEFPGEKWHELCRRMAGVFRMNDEELERMYSHKIMHLVGALPFIAGCRHPERTALSHLSVYILASAGETKEVFQHGFADNDSLFTRLERISHFDGGNSLILKRGMNMIAYAMLGDHRHDRESDSRAGKYNPLNTGVWNYEHITEKLLRDIRRVHCPELDEIMDIELGPLAYWAGP